MEREIVPGLYHSLSERDEPPDRLRRRDILSKNPILSNPKQVIISGREKIATQQFDKPEQKLTVVAPESTTEREGIIFQWIPKPPSQGEIEAINQPSTQPQSLLTLNDLEQETDMGRLCLMSPSASADTKSRTYKDMNYVLTLETKGYFMHPSDAGPTPEDVALCERLLNQTAKTPRGTLFDDEFIGRFHNRLHTRSEARLLVDLHSLLVPSAENNFIRGREELKDVIDGYNDSWLRTEPIFGPKPQPDHARGLRWSAFSESQRRKLGIKPGENSHYAVRDDMYFPYLTAEVKCGNQSLEIADRQNMHSMCIALRGVVSLAQAGSSLEKVHRRLLGFSVSHELEDVRIYGYYPEVVTDGIKYYRWPVKRFNIWTEENKWACYSFVENLDREFLPIHTDRLMRFLEEISDPQDTASELAIRH
ncbi:hypothetical protein MferCBS31731_003361 [Microsporum ferrugineum]